MTNINRSGITASVLASRAVLCNSNNERDAAIQEILSRILHDGAPAQKRMRLNDSKKSIQHAQASHLFNRALSLLCNSLNAIRTRGNKGDLQNIYENLNEKNIINRLWVILEFSGERPHEALLAAKCLYMLLTAFQIADPSSLHGDKRAVVDEACLVGYSSHAALFRECKGLLEIL